MFKQPFKISKHNLLSKKDTKKLKKKLEKHLNKKVIKQVFKMFHDKLFNNKVARSKIRIYGTEETPLFVDSTGKQDYFPTMYSIMLFPSILGVKKIIMFN